MKTPPSTIQVALLEDDESCRANLQSLLSQTPGFHCSQTFATAGDALKQLPKAPTDLIIVDLDLPGMSGEKFMSALRDLRLATKPVVLTAYNEPARIGAALEAGAFGYLLKPTPSTELVERLRDAYAGGAPMSPAVSLMVVQIFHRRGKIESQLGPHLFEILRLLAHGRLIDEIAEDLGLAAGSVRANLSRIYHALHVKNSTQAVALYHGAPLR